MLSSLKASRDSLKSSKESVSPVSAPGSLSKRATVADGTLPANDSTTTIFIVFFVNPKSGGQKGASVAAFPEKKFQLSAAPHAQVNIFLISDEDSRAQGVALIKELLVKHAGNPTITIQPWSGGGDGTVGWLYEILTREEIDMSKVVLGHLPFGTGNDFSQALGWEPTIGSQVEDTLSVKVFAEYCAKRINDGKVVGVDIWHCTFQMYPNGYAFRKVKDRDRTLKPVDEATPKDFANGQPARKFTRLFMDFFALGLEGWVARGFESKRTTSRVGNMGVYVGASSSILVTGVPPITRILDGIDVDNQKVLITDEANPNTPDLFLSPILTAPVTAPVSVVKGMHGLIKKTADALKFTDDDDDGPVVAPPASGLCNLGTKAFFQEPPASMGTLEQDAKSKGVSRLVKHPVEITLLNFPRIWARPLNFWDIPLNDEDKAIVNRVGPMDMESWTPQLCQDGKVEMMAVESVQGYLKEYLIPRAMVRIGQFGETPFRFSFRHVSAGSQKRGTTYVLCDGDAYKLVHPQYIEVKHHARPRYIARLDSAPAAMQEQIEQGVQGSNEFLKKAPGSSILKPMSSVLK